MHRNGMPHPSLQFIDHRPWPMPQAPWTMAQNWHDLLFAHWPISPEALRRVVPSELPFDTFDGSAWVGVVPFWMSGVRQRGLPAVPGLSRFPELNVRTYVTLNGKPGVYFFSLDADNAPAVWAARKFFHLPYFRASMKSEEIDGTIRYRSLRREKRKPERPAEFRGRYRPIREVQLRASGTLAHWLTERYCLYTTYNGSVYRSEIHHPPWPLQDAEAEIKVNTMVDVNGVTLPASPPILHFARKLEVIIWPLRELNRNH